MPRIVESDEEYDYKSEGDEPSVESDDEPKVASPPKKPAVTLHIASRSSTTTQQAAHIPSTQASARTPAPSRRRIGEDDDKPSPQATSAPKRIIITNTSNSVSSNLAKPLATNRMQTSEDELSMSDDESMLSPKAKRRKLASPSKSITKAHGHAKKATKADDKRFYSDDDEDFEGEDNALSDSDEDAAVHLDSGDEEDYRPKPVPKPKSTVQIVEETEVPVKRKRGRPPGSKNKTRVEGAPMPPPSPAAPKRGRGRPRKMPVDEVEDFEESDVEEDDMMDLISDSEEDYADELGEDEESDEEDQEFGVGSEGPKKMTARQKAIVGEAQAAHVALTGARPIQAPVEAAKPRRAPTLGKKHVTPGRPSNRVHPPDDTMQEVTTIVGQLMHRSALDKTETKRNIREEPMFNPDMVKFWSRADGNFVTIPYAQHSHLFPSQAGWSFEPVTSSQIKDIPTITLKRGILDLA